MEAVLWALGTALLLGPLVPIATAAPGWTDATSLAAWDPAMVNTSSSRTNLQSVTDGSGNTTVAWIEVDQSGATKVLGVSYTPGAGWSAPSILGDGGAAGQGNLRLAVTPSGEVIAVWHAGGSIDFSLKPATGAWSTAQAIPSVPSDTVNAPAWIGSDGAGNVTLRYLISDPSGQQAMMVSWSSAIPSWGSPNAIPGDVGVSTLSNMSGSTFAVAGDGELIDVYANGTSSGPQVIIRSAAGTWGAPQPLPAQANQFSVSTDSTGDALVMAIDGQRVKAVLRPAGGSFGSPSSVASATADVPAPGDDVIGAQVEAPQAQFDAGGHAQLVWLNVVSVYHPPPPCTPTAGYICPPGVTTYEQQVRGVRITPGGAQSPLEPLSQYHDTGGNIAPMSALSISFDANGTGTIVWGWGGVNRLVSPPSGYVWDKLYANVYTVMTLPDGTACTARALPLPGGGQGPEDGRFALSSAGGGYGAVVAAVAADEPGAVISSAAPGAPGIQATLRQPSAAAPTTCPPSAYLTWRSSMGVGRALGTAEGAPVYASSVQLDASRSSAGTAGATTQVADYSWDLDGSGSFSTDTGTAPTLTITQPTAGTRMVRVRVRDSKGNIDEYTRTIQFLDDGPRAALAPPGDPGCTQAYAATVGQPVSFDGASSVANGPIHYAWQIDSATPGVPAPPAPAAGYTASGVTLAFPNAARYSVVLTVTDDLGRKDDRWCYVNVSGGPTAPSPGAGATGGGATGGATSVLAPATMSNAALPLNFYPPGYSGMFQQGQTLTLSHGVWSNTPTAYSDRWERCNSDGGGCVPIPGATLTAYTLRSADVGHTLVVQESASNAAGASAVARSDATPVVVPADDSSGSDNPSTAPTSPSSTVMGCALTPPAHTAQARAAAGCGPIPEAISTVLAKRRIRLADPFHYRVIYASVTTPGCSPPLSFISAGMDGALIRRRLRADCAIVSRPKLARDAAGGRASAQTDRSVAIIRFGRPRSGSSLNLPLTAAGTRLIANLHRLLPGAALKLTVTVQVIGARGQRITARRPMLLS